MADKGIQRRKRADGSTAFRVRVDAGIDPVTGERRQRSVTFNSRKDAEVARRQWLTALERGTAVDPSKRTVGE